MGEKEGPMKQPTTEVPFVAVRKSGIVMRGAELICKAVSHNMAKRIANALNSYKPSKEGC